MVPAYEREAIRPHVLGTFRDLVLATARHPAMLFYLDNWLSTRAGLGDAAAGPERRAAARGLNENYARELMELHTLGVDGGYTQQDVTEVARAFTGWTIDRPRDGRPVRVPAGRARSGRQARARPGDPGGRRRARRRARDRHPRARIRRRRGSSPPSWRGTSCRTIRPRRWWSAWRRTFRASDGDIRAVMTTLVTSPEFWSRDAYRAKIKTPFELVVERGARARRAAVARRRARAGGGSAREVGRLGQPLYEAQPPTGYPGPRRVVGEHGRARSGA